MSADGALPSVIRYRFPEIISRISAYFLHFSQERDFNLVLPGNLQEPCQTRRQHTCYSDGSLAIIFKHFRFLQRYVRFNFFVLSSSYQIEISMRKGKRQLKVGLGAYDISRNDKWVLISRSRQFREENPQFGRSETKLEK